MLKSTLLLVSCIGSVMGVQAQSPQLLKDINTGPEHRGSNPFLLLPMTSQP